MDIQKFQQKLTEVCELGEKNGKVLKPEQIKECFGELDLDKSQLIKILQYLKLKGISIEGAEEISAASQTGPEEVSEEKEEKVPLCLLLDSMADPTPDTSKQPFLIFLFRFFLSQSHQKAYICLLNQISDKNLLTVHFNRHFGCCMQILL